MRYFKICPVFCILSFMLKGCMTPGGPEGLNFGGPWPGLTVEYPARHETFLVGQQLEIRWSWTGSVGDVKINLNPGADSIRTITTNTENDGRYTWTVPNTPFGPYRIKVSELAGYTWDDSGTFYITDDSPPDSIIVLLPSRPMMYYRNDYMDIRWTWHGTVGNVKIDLSTDGGSTWPHTITPNTENNGSYYNGLVGNTSSDSCRVRVSELDGEPWDMSDYDSRII